jgi:preprotein translocase subunit SecG
MQQLILIVHVLVAIAIIALVLVQHGKGADVGASFGTGSANTMFGSQGNLPFLMKLTAFLAAVFFATSLSLTHMAATGGRRSSHSLISPVTQQQTVPNTPQSLSLPDKREK